MMIEPLTQRETEVLRLLARGLTYALIADQLGISQHTVTTHIKNTYRKLDVHSARCAVFRALEMRFLDAPALTAPITYPESAAGAFP